MVSKKVSLLYQTFLKSILVRKRTLLLSVSALILSTLFISKVYASSTSTITTTADFQRGTFTSTESISKEGELKLTANGIWSSRVWKTPYTTLGDGTMITSDSTSTYLVAGRLVLITRSFRR
jgi:hypothetical protein